MKEITTRNIILAIGLLQTKVQKGRRKVNRIYYTYELLDVEKGNVKQSVPRIAIDDNFQRVKLAILIDVLTHDIFNFCGNIESDQQLIIHYAVRDDDLAFTWKELQEDDTLRDADYWHRIKELCDEKHVHLDFCAERSLLTPLSKTQYTLLSKEMGAKK